MKKPFCLLAVLALAFCTVSIASAPHTGIEGQVFICHAGPPAIQAPMATSFNILSARTREPICRVNTDENGRFKLSIHPGTYLLVPENIMLDASRNCVASAEPMEVTVRSKRFTPANIMYPMPCAPLPGGPGSAE